MVGVLRRREQAALLLRRYDGGCSSANDTAEYVYDGEGNRVQKIVAGGETVTYVYDAFGRLASEYSTAGPSGTAGSYFRTTDHLGSTRLVTKDSGNVHDRRDFFPFGEQILASSTYSNRHYVTGYNNTGLASGHLFTGKERGDLTTEGGLDYFGARYMSSALGRFTGADAPFENQFEADPQSWNLYAYVRNSPLRLIDKDGRYWDEAVRDASGKVKELRVVRSAGGSSIEGVFAPIDVFARYRRNDTNDQLPILLPGNFVSFLPSILGEDFTSTLGEKNFTRPTRYTYGEGVQLDEQAFSVAAPLLGLKERTMGSGGSVSMSVTPEKRDEFRRIWRGVRIKNELAGLRAKASMKVGSNSGNSQRQQRLLRDIREREEDEDYRYLLELERRFVLESKE